MLRKKRPSKEPSGGMVTRSLARIPLLKRLLPGAPPSLQSVGLLVDVFASFAMLDGRVDQSEANIILDLLRHAYPEADHGWLARRLQRAFKKPLTLEELADSMRPKLSERQLTGIGLQLYLLVNATGQKAQGKATFLAFMETLERGIEGEAIVADFEGLPVEARERGFETLTLGGTDADLELPPEAGSMACKVYRSGSVMLLQNSGAQGLTLGATQLPVGGCTRLRGHQRLLFPGWSVSHADLTFFFDAKYGKDGRTLYVGKHEEVIVVERNRSRQSQIKISFGLEAEVTALQGSDWKLSAGADLPEGVSQCVPLWSSLYPDSGAAVSLNQLRLQALDGGGRFKIDKTQQSCVLSNHPERLTEQDLRLTAGLAEPVTLKVTFDRKKGTGELTILEQGSNPILVNGAVASSGTALQDGCLIRLSSNQGVRCRFSEGMLDEERTLVQQLKVAGVSHSFGRNKVLDNIDLVLNRGEMLCIMGPSGSGKSTLMSAIAGQLAPSRGHIRLNEISLYQHHSRLSRFITYMPQEEALSSQLTVREHLRYAVKIRQPNLNTKEVQRRVDSILDELSLQPLGNRKVGSPDDKSLSGGERSRLNLGLDLGSQAEIFLFDEPISGLSSKDSEHVAESLKNISRDKIVVASLHRPGAKILSQFDKVLLLDNGGRVAFFGSPSGMREYFKEACAELQIQSPTLENENSADFVFDVLETPLVDMVNTQSFESTRRFPPLFWQERFESYTLYRDVQKGEIPAQTQLGELPRSDDNMPIPKKGRRRLNEYVRLFKSHFWRSALSKYRNKGTLYATFLEVPLLAFIIAWTLRASADGAYQFDSGLHIVTYLFLSVTVGMFLGLTNSATEILRDRPVLRRERNCRYHAGLYVLAKFLCLSILAAVQVAIYLSIGNWMLEIEGMWLNHWLWMTVTAMSGTAIALFVSSVVATERAALSAVPLILVPQLLLAGTPLIPFEEMNRGLFSGAQGSRNQGVEPIPSRIIPLRYAYEGIIVDQATKNFFEVSRRKINQAAQALKRKKDFAMTYQERGLSEQESDRLSVLLRSLSILAALEAEDSQQAKQRILKVTEIAFHGTMKDLQKMEENRYNEIYVDTAEPVACSSYFVNQRAEQLVLKQDIQRLDLNKEEKPNIFLAEKKYFGNRENPDYTALRKLLPADHLDQLEKQGKVSKNEPRSWGTSSFCLGVLGLLSALCVTFATFVVSRSSKRMK